MKSEILNVILGSVLLFATVGGAAARTTEYEPIVVGQSGTNRLASPVDFPADSEFLLSAPTGGWTTAISLRFEVVLPVDAPTNVQTLAYMKDWDHFWFQTRASDYLVAGQTNRFEFDLSARSREWQPRGHTGNWHFRVLADPSLFGIRLFSGGDYVGQATLQNVSVGLSRDRAAPVIGQFQQNAQEVPRFGKFEVTCRLPDRYIDPFDAEVISLQATFVSPSGNTNVVDGFYTHDFYRKKMPTEEYALPQGVPYWQVRYAPREEGVYQFSLKATDAMGEAARPALEALRAASADKDRYVRDVAKHAVAALEG